MPVIFDDEMDNKPTKEFQLWNGRDKLVKQIKESSLASYLHFTEGERLELTLYWALPYDSAQSFHLVWKGETPKEEGSWGIFIPAQGSWKSKKLKLSPHVSIRLVANKKCVSLRSFIFDLKGFPFLQDAWNRHRGQATTTTKRVRELNEEKLDQIKRLKLEPLEKQIEELQKQKEYWTEKISFIENHMDITNEVW